MPNPEHQKTLHESMKKLIDRRERNPKIIRNLKNASLVVANLVEAKLFGAILHDPDFTKANLMEAEQKLEESLELI